MKGDIYKTIIIRDDSFNNSRLLKPILFGLTNKIRTKILRECERFYQKYGDYTVTQERAEEFNLLPTGKRPDMTTNEPRDGVIYNKKNIEQLYNKTDGYKHKLGTELTQVTLMLTAHAVGDEIKSYINNKKRYDNLVKFWKKKCETEKKRCEKKNEKYVEPRQPFLLEHIYKNVEPKKPVVKPKGSYRILAIPGKRCYFVSENKLRLDNTGVTIKVPFDLFLSKEDVDKYLRYIRVVWNRNSIEYHVTFKITDKSKKRYSYQFDRMDKVCSLSNVVKKEFHFGLDMGESKYLTGVSTNPDCPAFYVPTDDIILHNIRYAQKVEAIKKKLPKGVYRSKALEEVYVWDKDFKKTWAHRAVARVLDVCLFYGAETLTLGKVKKLKERFRNKRNNFESNMCFYGIPHGLVVRYFEEMCELYGIEFKTVFERQSSITSSIDGVKGIREEQGKLVLSDGKVVNPDINGAINHIKWRFGERLEGEKKINYDNIISQFVGGIERVMIREDGSMIEPVALNVARDFEGFEKNKYYSNLHKKEGVLKKEREAFLSFSRNKGLRRKR